MGRDKKVRVYMCKMKQGMATGREGRNKEGGPKGWRKGQRPNRGLSRTT